MAEVLGAVQAVVVVAQLVAAREEVELDALVLLVVAAFATSDRFVR